MKNDQNKESCSMEKPKTDGQACSTQKPKTESCRTEKTASNGSTEKSKCSCN